MSKKLISLFLCLFLFVGCFSACEQTDADTEAPVISGVKDSTSIQLGDAFNALDGVTASDNVDGDLTSSIVLSSNPELTFTNGVCQPSGKGAYEIIYSVTDKAGNKAEEYCTLTVTNKTSTETPYYNFDFSQYDASEVPTFLNLVTYNEAQAEIEKTQGLLRLNVSSVGTVAGSPNSVTLFNDMDTNVGSSYKVNIYMKSSAPVWFNFMANHTAAGWSPLGTSAWNYNIPGTDVYTLYTVTFDAPAAAPADYAGEVPYGQVKVFLELGAYNVDGIGANPSSYSIDILKVEAYEIVGIENNESIKKTESFSEANADALFVSPAAGSTTYENGVASYNVSAFVPSAAGWEIHLRHKLGVAIEKDKKYVITYTMESDAEISAGGGVCIEHFVDEWQNRAAFLGSPVHAAGSGTYTLTFTSLVDLNAEDSALVWYLKDAPATQATVTMKLSSVEVFEVKGNKTSDKTNYHYYPFNGETEWTCWNDTDDDLGQGGLGTMYFDNGKMIYDIAVISGVDYGNKIFNNSLTFEEDCLYKITVTMKANKDCTCWFILNPPTAYDPIISSVFDVTTEDQTFTFTTTSEFVVEKDLQLIFSFGSSYNEAGAVDGGLRIEFSSINVIKLS